MITEAVRSMTNNFLGEGDRGGVGVGNDRTGGGASPDVCPRAPDTLNTPLEFFAGNCTEWRVSTFDSDSILRQQSSTVVRVWPAVNRLVKSV